jgi:hypothetical protein
MQTALRSTVTDVRQGSYAMHTGISEIAEGNNDLSARTEQQAASLAQTAASMEELTATVGKTLITPVRHLVWHRAQRKRRVKADSRRRMWQALCMRSPPVRKRLAILSA